MMKLIRRLLVVCGLALIISVWAVPMPAQAADAAQTEITATPYANLRMRSGPGTGYRMVNLIPYDTAVPVLARNPARTWIVVDYEDIKGWVFLGWVELNGVLDNLPVVNSLDELDSVAATAATEQPTVATQTPEPAATSTPEPATTSVTETGVTATTTARLRIRAAASTDSDQLGVIPYQTMVSVLARHSTAPWAVVNYNGTVGWSHTGWMTFDGVFNSLPAITRLEALNAAQAPAETTEATAAAPVDADATDETAVTEQATTTAGPAEFLAPNMIEQPVRQAQRAANDGRQPPYTVRFLIGERTRAIWEHGQALGNNPHRFTTIGDSETDNYHFLREFEHGNYKLGPYSYLEPVIDWFRGSWDWESQAAQSGLASEALFDPLWSDPSVCPNETRLQCEYRLTRPVAALVLLRKHPNQPNWRQNFHNQLETVVETSIDQGVIPVLTTVPYMQAYDAIAYEQSQIVVSVAMEYGVPVWDMYGQTFHLAHNGVDDTDHLSVPPVQHGAFDFSWEPNFAYGKTWHNLQALEVLHQLKTQIIAP